MGKKGRRNRAATATSPTPERSAFKPRPPPSSIHIEKRPVPDIREGTVDVGNLQLRISALLPTPNRQPGSLPTTAELKKLNKTGQMLARACALLERVSVTITSTSICDRFGNESDSSSTPIDNLIEWDEYMQGCVDVIEALSSTDFRVGPCVTEFIKSWPVPSPFFIPTSFHALGKVEYQLGNVSAQAWVVLLANLMIHVNINMVSAQAILRLVHELYLHADTMDWSKLKSNSCTESIDENTCRFALASAGIKICRRLYRLDNSERAPSPVDAQLSTCMLLDEIETFSCEQMKFRPECATGQFNMGWVAMQCPSRRKTDPVAAAADCLHWFTKACEVADCDKDDFVSAAARIEAAASIGLCAAGAVGITVAFETAVVRRDFRSEFGGMMKTVKMNEKAGRVTQYDIIDCLSSDHARKIMEYESDRVEKDIPPTVLLKGECHIIEWWEMLRLWNEATKYFDNLKKIGFSYFVYGETTQWESIDEQLHKWVEVKKLTVEQFASPVFEPGVPVMRDKGQKNCGFCNKANVPKLCSRCKNVSYCSHDCQRKHWKSHKVHCCPRF